MKPRPGSLLWLAAHDLTLSWRRFLDMFGRLPPLATWGICLGGIIVLHVVAWRIMVLLPRLKPELGDASSATGAVFVALRARLDDGAGTAGHGAHAAGARQHGSHARLSAARASDPGLPARIDCDELVRIGGAAGSAARQHGSDPLRPGLARRVSDAAGSGGDRHTRRCRGGHRTFPVVRSAPRAVDRAVVRGHHRRRLPAGDAGFGHAAIGDAERRRRPHCPIEHRGTAGARRCCGQGRSDIPGRSVYLCGCAVRGS